MGTSLEPPFDSSFIMIREGVCTEGKFPELAHALRAGELELKGRFEGWSTGFLSQEAEE
jgi:hypothetical protein